MGGGEASRRRGGEAAPAQCAAEELCVCESLTGSKWRRLLQRLLLCEGNNTPPRQRRRRRRRLRLAEHLPSGRACRRSVYPGQGALREEGQRQGAHPPESLLCDWGVAGGSSRSAEPGLRGRREGSPGPQPGAPRRSRPLRPPGPGPAFRGAGAARGASGRPVSADRPPLPGSGGGRAAAGRGHGEEGAPRGRGWPGARARLLTAGPGEAGAPGLGAEGSRSPLLTPPTPGSKARRGGLIQQLFPLFSGSLRPFLDTGLIYGKSRSRRLGFNFSSQFLESFTSHLDKNSRAKSPCCNLVPKEEEEGSPGVVSLQ